LDLATTLRLISPELVLGITGLAVLGLDLVWPDERKKGWLPYLSLLGLILALVMVISLSGQQASLLSGMISVDGFALFFKFIAILAVGIVILGSIDYMRERTPYAGEFYGLLVLAALALTLAAGATDLIMVYLSMEFLSFTSYILVGYIRDSKKGTEASLKYFLFGATTSAIMLYGISLLYGIAGTTNLAGISQALREAHAVTGGQTWLVVPAMIMILVGFGFKIALVPFHQWSPDTYEGAPTPITAFLSVGPKAIGFALLMRVFLTALSGFIVDWTAILAGISMITMTLGNLVALKQTNIKRLLAYSSIAQAGYILIGFVCVSLNSQSSFSGVNGSMIYLFAYLFTNLGVFMAVIAFEQATGSTEISDYAGLARRAPGLSAVMLVCLLSLAGIPATGGFIGKFFVFGSAIQLQFYFLAVVGIVNSVIAAFYYLNIVRYMFFVPCEEGADGVVAVPALFQFALAVTAAVTLLIGLYPQPFIDLAAQSVRLIAAT
jgi:NADH-quinone oxidoreductase subunit N